MLKFFCPSRDLVRTKHVSLEVRVVSRNRGQRLSVVTSERKYGTESGRELQATDLLDAYRGLVAQGRLSFDEDQIRVVMELRRLQTRLTDYVPPGIVSSETYNEDTQDKSDTPWWSHPAEIHPVKSELKSLVRMKSHADDIASLNTPKGLFLTGHPGSGKSMLVDLWFSIIPTPYKARKHYSTFVLELYRAVWEETRRRQVLMKKSTPKSQWNKSVRDRWRALFASGNFVTLRSPNLISNSSYMPSISYCIARRLLLSHWLLVFDEIQLLDVSSAGILSDVLSWFWRMGGIVVGTSNKVPDDLYRNGVQKERLEPFVEALKLRCPVIPLRGVVDYRKLNAGDSQRSTWFVHGREKEFEATVSRLRKPGTVVSNNIEVFGRPLSVRQLSDASCLFTFDELCDRSLGPADYISIASRYSTIIVTSVPVFRPDAKDRGRRFISFIDAVYEARCRLLCTSESDLEGLFFPDTAGPSSVDSNDALMMAESMSQTKETFRPNVSSYNSLPASNPSHPEPMRLETLSIFSGEEERFAYQRAYSRLHEMTSATHPGKEGWMPLHIESRRWETSIFANEVGDKTQKSSPTLEESSEENATPEKYQGERPHAPKLSEDHVWGVREDWGPKAKAWGKGATIYSDDNDGRR